MAITLEQYGIDRLSREDRWELLGLLWDSLPEPTPPIPEWHRQLLAQRRAKADASPEDVVSLAEVKARLLGSQ